MVGAHPNLGETDITKVTGHAKAPGARPIRDSAVRSAGYFRTCPVGWGMGQVSDRS